MLFCISALTRVAHAIALADIFHREGPHALDDQRRGIRTSSDFSKLEHDGTTMPQNGA